MWAGRGEGMAEWMAHQRTENLIGQAMPGAGRYLADEKAGSPLRGTGPEASQAELEPSFPLSAMPEPDLPFPEFYRSHFPGLVVFVMWLGAGAEEAADVAQETMTRAWRDWEKLRHPRAWVRKVASREYCRRIAACQDEPTDQIPAHRLALGMAADEAAILGAGQARVLELLRLLPPRQRQVMAWYYDGYAPAEIAEFLSLDPGAVRASLHKARDRLKPHLTGEGDWS
jgi:RNA polymerase sigma factor (sigma-70 family)